MSPATLTIPRLFALRGLVLATAVVGFSMSAFAQNRPVTNGVALAFPKQQSLEVPLGLTARLPHEIRIPVDVSVTELGKMKSVTLPVIEDSIYRGQFDSLLSMIEFVPGLRDGKPAEQLLPLEIVLRPEATMLSIISPVTQDSVVTTTAAYYAQALLANDVSVPKVQKMGPYGFPGMVSSSAVALPSVVARISTTSSGRARNIEIVHSTIQGQNDQIRSLLNWATFSAEPKSAGPPADNYVAFIFHPAVTYPTRRVSAVARDSARSARDFLVQILPDTLGLLVPPLPRVFSGDSVSVAEAQKKLYGRVAIDLDFDTAGTATIKRISRKERPVKRLVNLAIDQLKFHPALGFDGRPRNFSGLLYLDFEGSTIVRVHPVWLSDRRSPAIR